MYDKIINGLGLMIINKIIELIKMNGLDLFRNIWGICSVMILLIMLYGTNLLYYFLKIGNIKMDETNNRVLKMHVINTLLGKNKFIYDFLVALKINFF